MKTFHLFLILCLTLGLLTVFPLSPVFASTITVSNCNDSGAGSLRQAVADAVSGDTINFSVSCPAASPITLVNYIDIDKDLTISGAGRDIVLDGNQATRILLIQWGKTVTLEYMTLKNGLASGGGWLSNGAAIYDNGAYLTLSHIIFDGNRATGIGADGGTIFHGDHGSLTVLNSIFNANSAERYGGAIYAQVNTSVTDSAFTNNTAYRGGAYLTSTGGITSTFERVTMTGNTAIGPGNTTGVGGGIYLSGGTLNIYNSTFSGNGSASYTSHGGAIRADYATVTIKNSTIVNNLVDENYGGGGLMINNSTLSYSNSILANNTAGDCRTDEGLTVTQNTNNLVEVSIGCGTPYRNTDPNLGPLADNGGSTWTHALLPGSPAIDEGDDDVCLAADQRGVARPQGAACDIGAYELDVYNLFLPLTLR